MIAKKRGNARKTPEIVRFRGFEAMISFLASLYGCGTRIRTLVMTESESVALPLGDAALLTNAPHYSRFPRACQELLKKITEFSVNYRNYHHLREWAVAEMPGQCAGAWTANGHTAKALNHKQQYIMETAKSQCILPIWAGSRSAFSRKLLLCDADCAIFLLSVAVAEGVSCTGRNQEMRSWRLSPLPFFSASVPGGGERRERN